jgi:4,5-DOPA dioxygenase extradiol
VLVMGSGSITHNLRMVFSRRAHDRTAADDEPEMAESAAFRRWFVERSAAQDHDALFDYRRQAPHAALMHPTDEHLLPWYVAAGAGHDGPALRIHDSVAAGCLGMDAYAFGGGAPTLAQQLAQPEAAPA